MIFDFLKKLAKNKVEQEMKFSQMLGFEDMMYWAKIGEETQRIEYLKLLKDQPSVKYEGDFMFWILEGCKKEKELYEKKQEMIKREKEKGLHNAKVMDKIGAEVKSRL